MNTKQIIQKVKCIEAETVVTKTFTSEIILEVYFSLKNLKTDNFIFSYISFIIVPP